MLVLQSSGVAGPVAGVGLAALGVVVLVVLARRSVGRLGRLLGTETTPPGEVTAGPVQVEGEVVAASERVGTRLNAGLDDEPVATQYRGSGAGVVGERATLPIPQQFAPDVLNAVDAVPFYVAGDDGQVLVDGGRAELSLAADAHRQRGVDEDQTVEAALEPGDTVSVLGEAVPAESYGSTSTAPERLLGPLTALLNDGERVSAADSLDGEEFVITRTADRDLVVSDAAGGRGLLRQGLAAAFWTLAGLGLLGGGIASLVL